MKFGIFYEHQIPRPWNDGDELRLFQEALDQVELADRLGIDYAWEVEHHFLEEYSHSSAPEVFLAACSQRTKRIRLGHGITLMPPNYNHPARVAERIATLDLVSNGRVEWGTGESSSRIELEGFGVPYMDKRAAWEESVRECARMLAMNPYPGYAGKYFSMPCRNIVPKPAQRPHPPLWVACSNRDTIRLAAQKGIGALTFAFIDPADAKFWVEEYYDTFRKDCTPIGRTVNPQIAMVTGFSLHEDSATAIARGLEGFKFFGYALAHYYITGTHVPAQTDIWQKFQSSPRFPMMPTGGIGNPAEVRANLETFENVGVDQVIFIQQGGNNRHADICASLELFAAQVMPDFKARDAAQAKQKADELAPYIAKALAKIPPLDPAAEVSPIESYPVLMQKLGVGIQDLPSQRAMGPGVQDALDAGRTNPAS
jgi:alkanesulfonate monooxygenase SsuD/methylene tetrahydromethanopterin reductase-like flavin-dependent oxidoreductase (luciferase family)